MNICFFIGSGNISGGTYVIYQHAMYMKKQGHNVTIVAQEPIDKITPNWHPACAELDIIHIDNLKIDHLFDLVILTWWRTVLEVNKVKAKQYIYFVQSIESRFYPEAEKPLRKLVDSTYNLSIPIITEATWIVNYLQEHYCKKAHLARNGIDKTIYQPFGKSIALREQGKLRVLVEGPLRVPFKNVANTIKLCRRSKADEVWLLTSSNADKIHGVDRLFSKVPVQKVAEIYRSCDVIVKLSYVEGMFGPPLEMFHCGGTAITYNVSGYDEYIIDQKNALVANIDDNQAVINHINSLKDNQQKLDELKTNATITAHQWLDWTQSSKVFLDKVILCLGESLVDHQQIINKMQVTFDNYIKEEDFRINNHCQLDKIKKKIITKLSKNRYCRKIVNQLRTLKYKF